MRMKTMYVFLAEGFEEIEALAPVDVMRRAGLAVTLVSVTPPASLPRVLPVQGQMMSRSSSSLGPMGSAA